MIEINPLVEESQAQSPAPTEIQPAWLTYREAEVYCSLSRTTLWRLVESDQIRVARIGKAVRLQRESLESFLQTSGDRV